MSIKRSKKKKGGDGEGSPKMERLEFKIINPFEIFKKSESSMID
jgi:hypothetical protein